MYIDIYIYVRLRNDIYKYILYIYIITQPHSVADAKTVKVNVEITMDYRIAG